MFLELLRVIFLSKQRLQVSALQDFGDTLHHIENTRERHTVAPHFVLRSVLVFHQSAPVFLKTLE